MVCDRAVVGGWEKYMLEPVDGGHHAIKSLKHGKYCAVNDDNSIVCDRAAVGAWEKYKFDKKGKHHYFKSLKNGKYCSVDKKSGNRIICNSHHHRGRAQKYTMGVL